MSSREEATILVAKASAEMGWTDVEILAASSARAALDVGAEMPHPFREWAAFLRHSVSTAADGVRVADTGTGRFGVLLSVGPSGRRPKR
ncbi:hypothetical protein [Streptomyces sp. NPDC056192]|uniref:hypothetical protein n=1 Tax=unclassified Streptomyces TaxID=2593676 RepID=UPI0035DEFB7C